MSIYKPMLGTKKGHNRRRGSVLIEFAACVVMLIALLFGIVEFGWTVHNQLKLSNAARDGARDAAIGFSTDEIRARVRSRLEGVPGAIAKPATPTTSAIPATLDIDLRKSTYDSGAKTYSYNDLLKDKAATTTGGRVYNDAVADQLIRVQLTITHKSLTGLLPSRTSVVSVIMRRESNG